MVVGKHRTQCGRRRNEERLEYFQQFLPSFSTQLKSEHVRRDPSLQGVEEL